MALKANSFTPLVKEACDRLGETRYASALTKWAVDKAVDAGEKSLEAARSRVRRTRSGPRAFGLGTSLNVIDPTVVGEMHSYSVATTSADDDHLLNLLQELGLKLQSQVMCTIFETVEHCLNQLYAIALFQSRRPGSENRGRFPFEKAAFHKAIWSRLKRPPVEGSVAYFRRYAEWASDGTGRKFMQICRERLPLFRDTELSSRLQSRIESYQCLEFCRHKIVHAEGVYEESDLRAFDRGQRDSISEYTQRSLLSGRPMILPTEALNRSIARINAETLLMLHRGLTLAFAMVQDFCPPRPPKAAAPAE